MSVLSQQPMLIWHAWPWRKARQSSIVPVMGSASTRYCPTNAGCVARATRCSVQTYTARTASRCLPEEG